MSKKRRIIVIGSNSFSGSDFIDFLLEKGEYEVVGISRSPEKRELFLPYKKRRDPDFKFFQLDLNKKMSELLDLVDAFKPDAIANFAVQSEVAPSWDNPDHWFQTNCVALAQLVKHLRDKRYLKRYLHVSTPEVYGSRTAPAREDASFNASTPYAVSRAAQDMFLKVYSDRYGFPLVTVRSANVYGAHQQLWKIIPRSVIYTQMGNKIELHGGGTTARSFVHIRDVSRGELAALEAGHVNSIYHLGTGENHQIRDLVRMVCEAMHCSFEEVTRIVPDRPGQDAAYVLDTTKAREELGWGPGVILEEGIDEVIRWVKGNWTEIRRQPLEYVHSS